MIIVFSEWSGWNSDPMTLAELLDYQQPANTRATAVDDGHEAEFIASIRDGAADWSYAKEV
jgi:hypothetical protein